MCRCEVYGCSPNVLITRPPASFLDSCCDQKLRYDSEWPNCYQSRYAVSNSLHTIKSNYLLSSLLSQRIYCCGEPFCSRFVGLISKFRLIAMAVHTILFMSLLFSMVPLFRAACQDDGK